MTLVRSTRTLHALRHPSLAIGLLAAAVVGIAVGVLTAYGQAWLGESSGSLANSAGPWSLAAFFVARYNRRLFAAVPAAMVTLACCELGYVFGTHMRNGSTATSTVAFWLTAAVLAGPPLGVAAAWSTGHGVRRGVGFAVIAGVLIGEGIYGWTTIADTTDRRYWALELSVGLAIVVLVAVRGRRLAVALAMIATAAATALTVFVVARLA